MLTGNITINGQNASTDDFVIIEDESAKLNGQGELFVIGSAKELEYETYGEMMQRRMK